MKFYLLLIFFNSQYFFLNFNSFYYHANAAFNHLTKPIISFCAGNDHMCAVFNNQRMKCMGKADNIGALINYGDSPSTIGDNVAYFNPGASLSIAKVTCLRYGLCALLSTGNIKCVGDNSFGQTGIGVAIPTIGASSGYVGNMLPIVNLGTGVVVASIVGGYQHYCILTYDKKVKCVGRGSWGETGYGDTNTRGISASELGNELPYVDFGVGVEVASIHSSSSAPHSCVILSAPANVHQRLKCWGFAIYYQLGYDHTNNLGDDAGEMGDNLPVVDLGIESRLKQVTLGCTHTCALLIDDELKCWGSQSLGQLALGSAVLASSIGNSLPSVLIDSGKMVRLISAGGYHTCVVYDDMITMKCIGRNDHGQLGQGDIVQRGHTPTTMIPLVPTIDLGIGTLQIASIHSGVAFNCAIFIDHSVKCFGNNQYGKLGIGTNETRGDEPNEMGNNLHFVEFFSPTQAPTRNPTLPTQSPTNRPTLSPTYPTTQSPSIYPILQHSQHHQQQTTGASIFQLLFFFYHSSLL